MAGVDARKYLVQVYSGSDRVGGQILLLVPKYEIVIVMNRPYKVDGGENNAAFESFFNEVLPKVLKSVQ